MQLRAPTCSPRTAFADAQLAIVSPLPITDEQVEQVIIRTVEPTPGGATYWSAREMAKAVGLSHMAIIRFGARSDCNHIVARRSRRTTRC